MAPHEILPLDGDARTLLIEMADRLRPHRDELVSCWSKALRTPVLKRDGLSEESSQLIIRALVDHFLEYVGEGRFDSYFQEISNLAEEYIKAGLSYETMIMAMHLYEEASLPLLMREYPDLDSLMRVLLAQDHLYHNVLILVASTYFGRLNAEIESRAGQLQESYQRHEQFVSMVAHELRSPLSVILGYVQLAIKAKQQGAELKTETLERILSQANRLKRLMEDLQDASSINSGNFEVRKELCDLADIVAESARQHNSTQTGHRISVLAGSGVVASVDPDRITQVVDNLLTNAVKYSRAESEITVTVVASNGDAVVSVEDQGQGIAPEDMSLLFQPFSRLYRQSNIKGTGLGLYVTRAIVESHGGRIWAESQPGVGSRFCFTLPLTPASSAATKS